MTGGGGLLVAAIFGVATAFGGGAAYTNHRKLQNSRRLLTQQSLPYTSLAIGTDALIQAFPVEKNMIVARDEESSQVELAVESSYKG